MRAQVEVEAEFAAGANGVEVRLVEAHWVVAHKILASISVACQSRYHLHLEEEEEEEAQPMVLSYLQVDIMEAHQGKLTQGAPTGLNGTH